MIIEKISHKATCNKQQNLNCEQLKHFCVKSNRWRDEDIEDSEIVYLLIRINMKEHSRQMLSRARILDCSLGNKKENRL
jgi:hypothetical protein